MTPWMWMVLGAVLLLVIQALWNFISNKLADPFDCEGGESSWEDTESEGKEMYNHG